ncbi:hypothetical protein BHM03_00019814 [Ensete ventricosum]|uniref:Uncharacterized protein n=1 Tax=Ensete ventricosum TaxID=4639 RepID=A0A445MFW0_ENSVE|nr:hypothetical protein BHM03_00019814 [Ensete ventricosum]
MPSSIIAVEAADERPREMLFNRHDRRSSLQLRCSRSSKENCSFPSKIKNVDLLEKFVALNTEKLPRTVAKDRHKMKKNSVASPLGTSQKPWPGRKVTGVDEPVMNMSNVPFYLQRTENGDDIHGKALNFGVLDWGRLERWTYHQKCVTDVGGGDSTSSSTESSSFSTFGFSNQSCRTISSPLSRLKKSPVAYEREDSGHIEGSPGSRISCTKFPGGSDKDHDGDFCADVLSHKHVAAGNSKDSDLEAMSCNVMQARRSATPPPSYKTDDATTTGMAEDQNGSSMKAEECQSKANHMPQPSQDLKGRWDHLPESIDSGWLSSDSPPLTTDDWLAEGSRCSHSGALAEDVELIHRYPQVPHSCPLPRASLEDEHDMSCTCPSESAVPTDESICRNGDTELFSRGLCKHHSEANAGQEKSRMSEAKVTAVAGKKPSDHSSAVLKRMSRSSSSKEASCREQFDSVSCPYNSLGDQATLKNKHRQSPLRRILDPILKPKNNVHSTAAAAAAAALRSSRHSCELSRMDVSPHGLPKPLNAGVEATCPARRSMITSSQVPNERHAASMKQALLQVAWKNGLPLFMLSSCDSEVLAAAITIRSLDDRSDDDLECLYKMFSVNSAKKKSMFWSNYGNKGKRQQLISHVVAQLKVSLCKTRSYDNGGSHVAREFVLLGAPHPSPTSDKSVDSSATTELAAIVVEVPPFMCKSDSSAQSTKNPAGNRSASSDEKCLQADRLRVILPSGVHGSSTHGEPSPLIERWRSGGACDCGGWDEGCMLTVLSDKSQEQHDNTSCSFQARQTTDGTQRLELWIQGTQQVDEMPHPRLHLPCDVSPSEYDMTPQNMHSNPPITLQMTDPGVIKPSINHQN